MKSKEQKSEEMQEVKELVDESQNLALIEFSGIPTNQFNSFKTEIKKQGKLKLIKKTLLKKIFEEKGIEFNPKETKGQLGLLTLSADLFKPLFLLSEFDKEKLKILALYDLKNKKLVRDQELIKLLSKESKENFLSGFIYLLSSPLRSLLFILGQRSLQNCQTK